MQEAHGDGYLSALAGGRRAFGELARGAIRSASFDLNGEWSPWYTLHKTFAGLRDAYRYTGNRTALEVETRLAAWAERTLSALDDEQIQRRLNTEFGGMSEVLADLFADTGDRRRLDLSSRFEHRAVLDPLKRGEDPLSGRHGTTQVPKLVGSLARYLIAGDRADLDAARTFWQHVVRRHTFPTGGHGKDEYFREPGRLAAIVDGRTSESCNVYNMLKLTRLRFAIEPAVEYAEFHERALFNHVLGSIDASDGAMCDMVPVGRNVRKEYQDMFRSFTCCVGSGMENHALHGLGLDSAAADRLWVTLFAPSVARGDAAGVEIERTTDFPEGASASITVTPRAPCAFRLAVRRPSWAGEGFRVTVNGEMVDRIPPPGSYVEVVRTWRAGDQVAIALPKTLRLEPYPDDPHRVVVLWGPLVLAGDLGPEPARGPEPPQAPAAPWSEAPVIVAAGRQVTEWLTPVAGRPGTFRTPAVREFAGGRREVELVPFYRLHRRTYSAAWDLLTPAEFEARRAELAAGAAARQAAGDGPIPGHGRQRGAGRVRRPAGACAVRGTQGGSG